MCNIGKKLRGGQKMDYSNKKMNGDGMYGYGVMKKDHFEKDMGKTSVADCRYGKGDNPAELKESVDKLASYVRNNKVKR